MRIRDYKISVLCLILGVITSSVLSYRHEKYVKEQKEIQAEKDSLYRIELNQAKRESERLQDTNLKLNLKLKEKIQ